MKVLVYTPNLSRELENRVRARLGDLAGQDAEILIGGTIYADGQVQHLLSEMGYPHVAVYSTDEKPTCNSDGWNVRHVEQTRPPMRLGWLNCFERGRGSTRAMALDADCGFVFWDGCSFGGFLAIISLTAQGKPVEVIRADGGIAEVSSVGDFRCLLPARNPQHRRSDVNIPLRDQWAVAEQFIPSRSIAETLAKVPFHKWEMVDIIVGSPTPLRTKLEAFRSLSRYDDVLHEFVDEVDTLLGEEGGPEEQGHGVSTVELAWTHVAHGSFSVHRDAIEEALDNLENVEYGSFIYRKSLWDERPELFEEHEAGVAPFSSIKAALEDLRFEMVRDEWDDDAPFWSIFEKWQLAPDGTWENPFTYYAIKDEIVFFDRNAYDEEDHCWTGEDKTYGGSIAPDLNIRVPFGVGDVVTLDCRPFAPLIHALVIEAEDEGRAECCMPRVLHLDDYESKRRGEPTWTEAGPKHASSLHLCMPGYSPLYRMELYEGTLPEDEQLIDEVRGWLRGDAAKGKQLSEALMYEMSSEEILAFMAEHEHERQDNLR